MTKKKKLNEIFKFCKNKYLSYKKITRHDLYLIMELIDKKRLYKIIEDEYNDYNGLLK